MRFTRIDLNSDLGEGYGPWAMGDDQAMLGLVTSANIACGGHAGDPDTMFRTLTTARERGVVVGAHPSYPDKEGFGRRRIPCALDEIERFTAAQLGALMGVARLAGTRVAYVKPHGALGNVAAAERPVAEAVARAVRAVDPSLALLAISGTELERAGRDQGAAVYSEIFADRGYTADGQLAPRGTPGALISDAGEAVERMMRFLATGRMPTVDGDELELQAHSICVHGDSPHAVDTARRLRAAMTAAGIAITPFLT